MASFSHFSQRVNQGSHEWNDITNTVSLSYLDPGYNGGCWMVSGIYKVANPSLELEYRIKTLDFAKKNVPDLTERYFFTCYRQVDLARQIIERGLECRATSFNYLGQSVKGVNLCRHADVQLKAAEATQQDQCWLMVFKVLMGRCRAFEVNIADKKSSIQPTPGFDCHIASEVPSSSDDLRDQAVKSQIYLYEIHNDGTLSRRPRQCLPYAVVMHKRNPNMPRAVPKSSGYLGLPTQPGTANRTSERQTPSEMVDLTCDSPPLQPANTSYPQRQIAQGNSYQYTAQQQQRTTQLGNHVQMASQTMAVSSVRQPPPLERISDMRNYWPVQQSVTGDNSQTRQIPGPTFSYNSYQSAQSLQQLAVAVQYRENVASQPQGHFLGLPKPAGQAGYLNLPEQALYQTAHSHSSLQVPCQPNAYIDVGHYSHLRSALSSDPSVGCSTRLPPNIPSGQQGQQLHVPISHSQRQRSSIVLPVTTQSSTISVAQPVSSCSERGVGLGMRLPIVIEPGERMPYEISPTTSTGSRINTSSFHTHTKIGSTADITSPSSIRTRIKDEPSDDAPRRRFRNDLTVIDLDSDTEERQETQRITTNVEVPQETVTISSSRTSSRTSPEMVMIQGSILHIPEGEGLNGAHWTLPVEGRLEAGAQLPPPVNSTIVTPSSISPLSSMAKSIEGMLPTTSVGNTTLTLSIPTNTATVTTCISPSTAVHVNDSTTYGGSTTECQGTRTTHAVSTDDVGALPFAANNLVHRKQFSEKVIRNDNSQTSLLVPAIVELPQAESQSITDLNQILDLSVGGNKARPRIQTKPSGIAGPSVRQHPQDPNKESEIPSKTTAGDDGSHKGIDSRNPVDMSEYQPLVEQTIAIGQPDGMIDQTAENSPKVIADPLPSPTEVLSDVSSDSHVNPSNPLMLKTKLCIEKSQESKGQSKKLPTSSDGLNMPKDDETSNAAAPSLNSNAAITKKALLPAGKQQEPVPSSRDNSRSNEQSVPKKKRKRKTPKRTPLDINIEHITKRKAYPQAKINRTKKLVESKPLFMIHGDATLELLFIDLWEEVSDENEPIEIKERSLKFGFEVDRGFGEPNIVPHWMEEIGTQISTAAALGAQQQHTYNMDKYNIQSPEHSSVGTSTTEVDHSNDLQIQIEDVRSLAFSEQEAAKTSLQDNCGTLLNKNIVIADKEDPRNISVASKDVTDNADTDGTRINSTVSKNVIDNADTKGPSNISAVSKKVIIADEECPRNISAVSKDVTDITDTESPSNISPVSKDINDIADTEGPTNTCAVFKDDTNITDTEGPMNISAVSKDINDIADTEGPSNTCAVSKDVTNISDTEGPRNISAVSNDIIDIADTVDPTNMSAVSKDVTDDTEGPRNISDVSKSVVSVLEDETVIDIEGFSDKDGDEENTSHFHIEVKKEISFSKEFPSEANEKIAETLFPQTKDLRIILKPVDITQYLQVAKKSVTKPSVDKRKLSRKQPQKRLTLQKKICVSSDPEDAKRQSSSSPRRTSRIRIPTPERTPVRTSPRGKTVSPARSDLSVESDVSTTSYIPPKTLPPTRQKKFARKSVTGMALSASRKKSTSHLTLSVEGKRETLSKQTKVEGLDDVNKKKKRHGRDLDLRDRRWSPRLANLYLETVGHEHEREMGTLSSSTPQSIDLNDVISKDDFSIKDNRQMDDMTGLAEKFSADKGSQIESQSIRKTAQENAAVTGNFETDVESDLTIPEKENTPVITEKTVVIGDEAKKTPLAGVLLADSKSVQHTSSSFLEKPVMRDQVVLQKSHVGELETVTGEGNKLAGSNTSDNERLLAISLAGTHQGDIVSVDRQIIATTSEEESNIKGASPKGVTQSGTKDNLIWHRVESLEEGNGGKTLVEHDTMEPKTGSEKSNTSAQSLSSSIKVQTHSDISTHDKGSPPKKKLSLSDYRKKKGTTKSQDKRPSVEEGQHTLNTQDSFQKQVLRDLDVTREGKDSDVDRDQIDKNDLIDLNEAQLSSMKTHILQELAGFKTAKEGHQENIIHFQKNLSILKELENSDDQKKKADVLGMFEKLKSEFKKHDEMKKPHSKAGVVMKPAGENFFNMLREKPWESKERPSTAPKLSPIQSVTPSAWGYKSPLASVYPESTLRKGTGIDLEAILDRNKQKQKAKDRDEFMSDQEDEQEELFDGYANAESEVPSADTGQKDSSNINHHLSWLPQLQQLGNQLPSCSSQASLETKVLSLIAEPVLSSPAAQHQSNIDYQQLGSNISVDQLKQLLNLAKTPSDGSSGSHGQSQGFKPQLYQNPGFSIPHSTSAQTISTRHVGGMSNWAKSATWTPLSGHTFHSPQRTVSEAHMKMDTRSSTSHQEVWKQPATPDCSHLLKEPLTALHRRGSIDQAGRHQVIDYEHGSNYGNEYGYSVSHHRRLSNEMEQRGRNPQRRLSVDQHPSCLSPRAGHSPRAHHSRSPSNSSFDGDQRNRHVSGDIIWKIIPIDVPPECGWWSTENRIMLPVEACLDGDEPKDPRDNSKNYIRIKQMMARASHIEESNMPAFHTNIITAVPARKKVDVITSGKEELTVLVTGNADDNTQSGERSQQSSIDGDMTVPENPIEFQKYLDDIPNKFPHITSKRWLRKRKQDAKRRWKKLIGKDQSHNDAGNSAVQSSMVDGEGSPLNCQDGGNMIPGLDHIGKPATDKDLLLPQNQSAEEEEAPVTDTSVISMSLSDLDIEEGEVIDDDFTEDCVIDEKNGNDLNRPIRTDSSNVDCQEHDSRRSGSLQKKQSRSASQDKKHSRYQSSSKSGIKKAAKAWEMISSCWHDRARDSDEPKPSCPIEFGGLDLSVEMRMQHVEQLPPKARLEVDNHTRQLFSLTLNAIQNEKQFYDPTQGLDKDRRMRLIRSGEVNPTILEELKIEHDLDLVDRELDILGDEVEGLRYIMDSKKYTVEQARMYDKTEYQMKVAGLKKEVLHRKLEKLYRFHKSSYVEVLPSTFCLSVEEGKYISVEGVLLFLTLPLDLQDCQLMATLKREINEAHTQIRTCPMTDVIMAQRRRDLLLRLGWLHIKRRTILSKICCGNNDFKCTLADRFLDRITSYRKIQEEIQEDCDLQDSIVNDHICDRISELESHLKVLRSVKRLPSGVWEGIANRMDIKLMKPVPPSMVQVKNSSSNSVLSTASLPSSISTNVSIPVVIGGQERKATLTETRSAKPISVRTLMALDEKNKAGQIAKQIPKVTSSHGKKHDTKLPLSNNLDNPNLKQVKIEEDLPNAEISRGANKQDNCRTHLHSVQTQKDRISDPNIPTSTEVNNQKKPNGSDVTLAKDGTHPDKVKIKVKPKPIMVEQLKIRALNTNTKQPIPPVEIRKESPTRTHLEAVIKEKQSQGKQLANDRGNMYTTALQQTPQAPKTEVKPLLKSTSKPQLDEPYENLQITVRNDMADLPMEHRTEALSKPLTVQHESPRTRADPMAAVLQSPPKTKSEISDFLKQMRQDSEANKTTAGSENSEGKAPEQALPQKKFKPTFQAVHRSGTTESDIPEKVGDTVGVKGSVHSTSRTRNDGAADSKQVNKKSREVDSKTETKKTQEAKSKTKQKKAIVEKTLKLKPPSTDSVTTHHIEKQLGSDINAKYCKAGQQLPSHQNQTQIKSDEIKDKKTITVVSSKKIDHIKSVSVKKPGDGTAGSALRNSLGTCVEKHSNSGKTKGNPCKELVVSTPTSSLSKGPVKASVSLEGKTLAGRSIESQSQPITIDRPTPAATVSLASHNVSTPLADIKVVIKVNTSTASQSDVLKLDKNFHRSYGDTFAPDRNIPQTTQQEMKLQCGEGLESFKIPRRTSKDGKCDIISRISSLETKDQSKVTDYESKTITLKAVSDVQKQITLSKPSPNKGHSSQLKMDKEQHSLQIPKEDEADSEKGIGHRNRATTSISPSMRSTVSQVTGSPVPITREKEIGNTEREKQFGEPLTKWKNAKDNHDNSGNKSTVNMDKSNDDIDVERKGRKSVSPTKRSNLSSATEFPAIKCREEDIENNEKEKQFGGSKSGAKTTCSDDDGDHNAGKWSKDENDKLDDNFGEAAKASHLFKTRGAWGYYRPYHRFHTSRRPGGPNKFAPRHKDARYPYRKDIDREELCHQGADKGNKKRLRKEMPPMDSVQLEKDAAQSSAQKSSDFGIAGKISRSFKPGMAFRPSAFKQGFRRGFNRCGSRYSYNRGSYDNTAQSRPLTSSLEEEFNKNGPPGQISGTKALASEADRQNPVSKDKKVTSEKDSQNLHNVRKWCADDPEYKEKGLVGETKSLKDNKTNKFEIEGKPVSPPLSDIKIIVTQLTGKEQNVDREVNPLRDNLTTFAKVCSQSKKGTTGKTERMDDREMLTNSKSAIRKRGSEPIKTDSPKRQTTCEKQSLYSNTSRKPSPKFGVQGKGPCVTKTGRPATITETVVRPDDKHQDHCKSRAQRHWGPEARRPLGPQKRKYEDVDQGLDPNWRQPFITGRPDTGHRDQHTNSAHDFSSDWRRGHFSRSISPPRKQFAECDQTINQNQRRVIFGDGPQWNGAQREWPAEEDCSREWERQNRGGNRAVFDPDVHFTGSDDDFSSLGRWRSGSGGQRQHGLIKVEVDNWSRPCENDDICERTFHDQYEDIPGPSAAEDKTVKLITIKKKSSKKKKKSRKSERKEKRHKSVKLESRQACSSSLAWKHKSLKEEKKVMQQTNSLLYKLQDSHYDRDEPPIYRRLGRGRGKAYDSPPETPSYNQYDSDEQPRNYQRPGSGRRPLLETPSVSQHDGEERPVTYRRLGLRGREYRPLLDTPSDSQYDDVEQPMNYRRPGRGRGERYEPLIESPIDHQYNEEDPPTNYQRPGYGRGEGHSGRYRGRGGRGWGIRPYKRFQKRGYRGGC